MKGFKNVWFQPLWVWDEVTKENASCWYIEGEYEDRTIFSCGPFHDENIAKAVFEILTKKEA
jgi:hypothetical protein